MHGPLSLCPVKCTGIKLWLVHRNFHQLQGKSHHIMRMHAQWCISSGCLVSVKLQRDC